MKSKDQVDVSIMVAGRRYPLLATPAEAELLEKVESQLKQDIEALQRQFTNTANQDILAMVLITYTKKILELGGEHDPVDPTDSIKLRLDALGEALDKALAPR